MAIRSKRKKSKSKKISFKLGGLTKRKRKRASFFGPSLIAILKVLVVVCVLCGIIIGLLETFTGGYLSTSLREIVPYIGLVIILMLRPYGLFGLVEIERV